MTFGPPIAPRICPRCQHALPVDALVKCPACGADLKAPADVGTALVEAMKSVLGGVGGDATPKKPT